MSPKLEWKDMRQPCYSSRHQGERMNAIKLSIELSLHLAFSTSLPEPPLSAALIWVLLTFIYLLFTFPH